ncbi:DNA methylase N-4 [Kaistia algarum]|uniref:DNA methyltransferase n=1 Tax=Kaistia algarum TaxID=2083279 RepID=UPI000CE78C51|nr:DNA methyltransferase [Kaistia algarum]MCX5516211.1 DNA methyltransferase [Kaistia algarum]PPE78286.1 DNA methylase N-4 [Kaistia algarum]
MTIDAYRQFLAEKVPLAPSDGIVVSLDEVTAEPILKPHVRAIVPWALRGGRRALFLNFGLHKTRLQLELMRLVLAKVGGPVLIVMPLGVRQEFRRDAVAIGVAIKFIRSAGEIDAAAINITNYETIRDGKLDPNLFIAVSLDEAAVLRSYGSKTFQEFLPLFERVRFKFVATATPSPNRTKELIHYAGFLGVMDTGQALTRFFQRDSESAGNLTLYPHKEEEFWLWVHSWAIFVQAPSDLGFSDDGYVLPPVTVNWHEVPVDHATAAPDRDGQGALFRNAALGLSEAAGAKRDSLPARIEKLTEIIAEDPESHMLIWHDLEAERRAIEAAVPDALSIHGSMDLDIREARVVEFSDGKFRHFATKPILSGAGCNFQRHCHRAVFLGIGFKFHDFIQAFHRIVRFGQAEACTLDLIYSEDEREIRRELERKWAEHDRMMAKMSEIIRAYGLDQLPIDDVLSRSVGVARREIIGERFRIAHNDCVDEARRTPDNSVHQIISSIPFSNHYEYTASYNDFGHTDDNDHFWRQMDFLTPELHRILQPGRLACIHVKDRILFGNVTGEGVPTVSPFHAEAIFHYRQHGFQYFGMITIVTDVVRENNQTYRLGYTEMMKDGTKMGVGCPEYVLLFRKRQSDRSKGYADLPVRKTPEDYSLARWQIDAHAFWRSSGDRLLTVDELAALGPAKLAKFFTDMSLAEPYDHERHVALGEAIEARRPGALPRTFMALAPGSHDPAVWHDIVRMRTLNGNQSSRNVEKHVCPLQFDIVDRLIDRYSNPDEIVYDPFGGLMTVPYRAILKGRRGAASELHTDYFRDGLHYCREAEAKRAVPGLFDTIGDDMTEAAE